MRVFKGKSLEWYALYASNEELKELRDVVLNNEYSILLDEEHIKNYYSTKVKELKRKIEYLKDKLFKIKELIEEE